MSLVKVIPLGGVGEIGKNCTLVEQGEDIVVVDCGLTFPDEEHPGVDFIVPDFTYLIQNQDRVRGIVITHAHEDHIGGLPFLLKQIQVPLYVNPLSEAIIRHKLDEKLPGVKVDYRVFNFGDVLKLGELDVEPIKITHSIPESACMAIKTVHGYVLFTGDFKIDFTPVDAKPSNLKRLGEIGEEGVVLLLSDSTNVEREGWGPSEREISEGFERTFREAKGRVLITAFASNIHRMAQAIAVAHKTGRKVTVVGRSMERNIDIAQRLGLLKIPSGTLIGLEDSRSVPNEKLVVLLTGSQGETLSALAQMSRGEYGRLQTFEGDTLIYSARPIPGNEGPIWKVLNRMFDLGCDVIYDSDLHIHVSGHGYQEELKMMINLTQPFYVAPVHGESRHQHLYAKMALSMGYPRHRVFTLKEGQTLVLDETKALVAEEVPHGEVMVDQSGAVGVPTEVIKERIIAGTAGTITVIVTVDTEHGEIVGDPKIVTRGFFSGEGVVEDIHESVVEVLAQLSAKELEKRESVSKAVTEACRRFIGRKLQARPLIDVVFVDI